MVSGGDLETLSCKVSRVFEYKKSRDGCPAARRERGETYLTAFEGVDIVAAVDGRSIGEVSHCGDVFESCLVGAGDDDDWRCTGDLIPLEARSSWKRLQMETWGTRGADAYLWSLVGKA